MIVLRNLGMVGMDRFVACPSIRARLAPAALEFLPVDNRSTGRAFAAASRTDESLRTHQLQTALTEAVVADRAPCQTNGAALLGAVGTGV